MLKWLGWIVANIVIVVLVWQKSEWQKKEAYLEKEITQLQERTGMLEQSIADLYVQLDQLEEKGMPATGQARESVKKHFSSALKSLKQGVKKLKQRAEQLSKPDGEAPTDDKPEEDIPSDDKAI